ncbi:MAG TPA: hypothetical protein PK894_00480 [Defluviitoga sp.]|nr:hypothetical protein [Defluviitoga sp.]HOP24233.1 hypothetical protein [Defluviitoga sp.]HPZ28175.1 hypothetical protein [Defluviitoga sp.]HQD62065.1 hypothetical protein [Defluviitoga sp.]
MSEGLKIQNSNEDPIKILLDKYPRIIILKAVFNLLDSNETVNLESLESEIIKLLTKK